MGEFDVAEMLADRAIHGAARGIEPAQAVLRGLPGRLATIPRKVAAGLSNSLSFEGHWRPAFPNSYLFFAVFCLCDFVQTCFILSLGGSEANEIALWMMQRWGLAGAAVYKGALMALVIAIIEWSVRRDSAAARRLANYSLVIGGYPVLIGVMLLAIHFDLHAI